MPSDTRPPCTLMAIKIIRWHSETYIPAARHWGPMGRGSDHPAIRAKSQPSHLWQLVRIRSDGARGLESSHHLQHLSHFIPAAPAVSWGSLTRRVSSEGQFKMPWVARCCDMRLNCKRRKCLGWIAHTVNRLERLNGAVLMCFELHGSDCVKQAKFIFNMLIEYVCTRHLWHFNSKLVLVWWIWNNYKIFTRLIEKVFDIEGCHILLWFVNLKK